MWSGAAVETGGAAAVEGEAELGGDDDLIAYGCQGLADEFLVGERTVHLGGVEEGDAAVDGGADQGDAVLAGDGRAVAVAEAHAAEPDRGDLQAAGSKVALDHGFSLSVVSLSLPVVSRRGGRRAR
jgi:hypothetical protein